MRRVHLPTGALTAVFVTAAAVLIYAGGSALHGSGFLAVFIAGILVGDVRAPFPPRGRHLLGRASPASPRSSCSSCSA